VTIKNQNSTDKKLLLLDGFSLAFRAFYALPDTMKTKLGVVSNAAAGFANMLVKLIETHEPTHICVAFDTKEPTYRNELEPAYKAQRGETPPEFIPQVDMIKNVCEVMGVAICESPGAEADDIIATYARQGFEQEIPTIIVTGDRDSFQCVQDPYVKVLYNIRGVSDYALYDEPGIVERTGIKPSQYVDYAAMRGDTSDNLPGIRGVGEKTASKLLIEYTDIDGIYENINELTPRQKKLFEDGKEIVYKNVKMMKLMTELEGLAIIDDLTYVKEYSKKAQSLFDEYSFKNLHRRLLTWGKDEEVGVLKEPKKQPSGSGQKSLLDEIEAEPLSDEDQNLVRKANIAQYLLDPSLPKFIEPDEFDFADLEKDLKSNNLYKMFEDLELPLISILKDMENKGILIDLDYLSALSKDFSERIEVIKADIYNFSEDEFNLNSPKQLSKVLYEELGLPILKKTKTGASTNAQVLEKLKGSHEIIELILNYRELEKLRNTYIDVLPKLVGDDGRLHPSYNQIGAITGRISSDNPNIQNIPIRTAEGRKLRKAFIAKPGYELISCDYSQIELRLMAHMADDEILIKAILEGKDVHTITASKIFHISEDEVKDQQRSFAKAVNYGIAYGMENYGLATRLNITPKEADEILNSYFEQFPSINNFMNKCIADAKESGYTETLWGRKRYLPDLESSNYMVRKQAERMAMNAPIQGTAADVMKKAIIEVFEYVQDKDCELLLTVHDELILEAESSIVKSMVEEVGEIMKNVIDLKVPLDVNGKFGSTWDAIH
jgi:DNA polymerase-1